MKILALERECPGQTGADFEPYLQAEAARAWELHQSGTIRELYFRTDEHTAVLVLECATLDEARRALGSLPLVQAGLIAFDLLPLRAYDGFERLFGAASTASTEADGRE